MADAPEYSTGGRGVLAGGNFIVDYVKIIDAYPQQDRLASIESESSSNGGGPYNVLKDLAALGADFPLEAAGLVGRDPNGAWILDDCQRHGIETAQLRQTDAAPTSYTDVMSVGSTGRRTFFHQRGANAILDAKDFDFEQSPSRLFHLGYLLLLDRLDEFDSEQRTGASRVLASATEAGLQTSVDLVSAEHPQFVAIVDAALPHTDVLFLNEIEASALVGEELAADRPAEMLRAAEQILQRGVRKRVVLHSAHGAVVATSSGEDYRLGSLRVPAEFIRGATGAGDAFAAGFLFGMHEAATADECLRYGVCAAASCLSHPTTSGGIRPLQECLNFGDEFGFAEF